MRPLRSVLKRRPQSILSQQALAFASSIENDVDSNQVYIIKIFFIKKFFRNLNKKKLKLEDPHRLRSLVGILLVDQILFYTKFFFFVLNKCNKIYLF